MPRAARRIRDSYPSVQRPRDGFSEPCGGGAAPSPLLRMRYIRTGSRPLFGIVPHFASLDPGSGAIARLGEGGGRGGTHRIDELLPGCGSSPFSLADAIRAGTLTPFTCTTFHPVSLNPSAAGTVGALTGTAGWHATCRWASDRKGEDPRFKIDASGSTPGATARGYSSTQGAAGRRFPLASSDSLKSPSTWPKLVLFYCEFASSAPGSVGPQLRKSGISRPCTTTRTCRG